MLVGCAAPCELVLTVSPAEAAAAARWAAPLALTASAPNVGGAGGGGTTGIAGALGAKNDMLNSLWWECAYHDASCGTIRLASTAGFEPAFAESKSAVVTARPSAHWLALLSAGSGGWTRTNNIRVNSAALYH